jgi:cysteinyl-tRNA synthetase
MEKDIRIQASTIVVLGEVMGILQSNPEEYFQFDVNGDISNSEINKLIEERNIARSNKDFSKADDIREKLLLKDIILEDKEGKTSWKKLS